MLIVSAGFLFKQSLDFTLLLLIFNGYAQYFLPIKYAILPEILKPNELMSGNALFQSGTSIAILIGMILGGAVISLSQGNMIWICLTIVSIAVVGYLSSRFVLKQSTSNEDLEIDWNFFRTSFQTIRYAKSLPLIFIVLFRQFLVLVLWCNIPHTNFS